MTAHIGFTPIWSDQAKELGSVLNTSTDYMRWLITEIEIKGNMSSLTLPFSC
jgi:hypothetical protein